MTLRKLSGVVVSASFAALCLFSPADLRAAPAENLPAPESTQSADLNALEAKIAEAVRTRPALHGAWLRIDAVDSGEPGVAPRQLKFRRVVDRGRAAAQRRELDQLVASLVPAGGYVVLQNRDEEYPVTELIGQLQAEVEVDPRLPGCRVSDAYFAPDPNQVDRLQLMLLGRVGDERQVERTERLCSRMMRARAAWRADSRAADADRAALAVTPNLAKLQVALPSEALGKLHFTNGMNRFRANDYAAASREFREATLEAPHVAEHHYWWALADLVQGNRDRAGRRLLNAAQLFGAETLSNKHTAVNRSLQRVQGPLRLQLQNIEKQALLEAARTPRQ